MRVARPLAVASIALCACSLSWAGDRTAKRRGISLSPDGRVAVATGKTRAVAVLDADGNKLREEPLTAPAAESSFSPDGKMLAICLEKGGLVVSEQGRPSRRISEPAGECSDLAWSADGRKLYYLLTRVGTESPNAPDDTQELKIWDAATERLSTGHSAAVERPGSGFKGNVAPTPQPIEPSRPSPRPDALGRMPQ